jgi:hypothetical protein
LQADNGGVLPVRARLVYRMLKYGQEYVDKILIKRYRT